jgi:hypothetical protein
MFSVSVFLSVVLNIEIARAQAPTNPPGSYYTSWLGNTFLDTKGSKVVTEELNTICVSPNGKVFTAGYAETGGGGASFNASDGSFAGRYGGSNTGFGDPLSVCAADNNYVYYGTSGYGILRAAHGGTAGSYKPFLKGKYIQGLYVKDGKLYVSDFGDGKYGLNGSIRILNISTMAEESSFACASPTNLTVDNAGNIWVVIASDTTLQNPTGGPYWWGEKVKSFSPAGVPGPEITDFEGPIGVAVDNNGLLLVGGMNANSQIWKYDVSATPTKVGTFGAENGIFGGVAGAFTDSAKLHWVRSIAVDADNNILTGCCYGTFWGGVIEKWNPDGKLLWRNFAGTSLDCGSIDPDNETEVYSKFHHYSLDYSKRTPGTEWSVKGFTVNRFKYPNDSRVDPGTDVGSRSLGAGAWKIGGKLFIGRCRQEGYDLELYRKETSSDGEVMVPSVKLANGGGTDNQFYNVTTKSWYTFPKYTQNNLGYNCYWSIGKNGDLFTLDGSAFHTVIRYPFGGLDANSNPIWRAETAITYTIPDFGGNGYVRRILYDSDNDVLYAGGNASYDNNIKALIRYDHFTTGMTKTWEVPLPFNDKEYTPGTGYGAGTVIATQMAGDYIFLCYGYGHIRILNKTDGSLVGTIVQSVNGMTGSSGQVDATYGMSAFKRPNGEYVCLFENAGWANIMMHRWCPDGKCAENCVNTVDSLKLNLHGKTLVGADTVSLSYNIYPDTVCNRSVSWTASDNSVVKVGPTGVINGLKPGIATIKATSQGDNSKSDSCIVTVTNVNVESVTVSPEILTINTKEKSTLTATLYPIHSIDRAVSWKSANPSVATVDSLGTVRGITPGNTSITATTHDGEKTDACAVTITQAPMAPKLISLRFNDGSGTIAANTGILPATFKLTANKPIWSVNVPASGGSNSVDFGTNADAYAVESNGIINGLKSLDAFTITGWLNCRSNEEGGGGNRIVSWINAGGDGVDLVYNGDGALRVSVNEWPDNVQASSPGKITTDANGGEANWKFFAVTYNADNQEVKYYFGDNAANATLDQSIPYNRGTIGTDIQKLAIGHFNDATRNDAADRMFRGLIDEINIFGEDLTLEQIIAVQNNTITGIDESLNSINRITLFPNPFKNELTVSEQVDVLSLYTIDGVLLLSEANTKNINTAGLLSGFYIVKIQKNNSVYNFKCIKK